MTTTITATAPTSTVEVTNAGYKDWWCPCGITPSDVVAAYAAKGAANYAASRVNLANPGTYDFEYNGDLTPDWNSTDGWVFTGFSCLYTASNISYDQNMSFVIKFSNITGGLFRSYSLVTLADSGSNSFFICESDGEGWAVMYGNDSNTNQYTSSEIFSGILALEKMNLYLDGELLMNGGNVTDYSSSHCLTVGAFGDYGSGFNSYLKGNIQAVALYNKRLTQAQIQQVGSAMP